MGKSSVDIRNSCLSQAGSGAPLSFPPETVAAHENEKTTKRRARPRGWVYFATAQRVGSDSVKIGFTRDLKRRTSQLNIASPERIGFCLVIPGTMRAEKALHRRFARYRLQGEWFRASDELVGFIINGRLKYGIPDQH